MVNIEVKGLDDFLKKCNTIQDMYPAQVSTFMDLESKAFISECKKASPYASFKKRWFTKSKKQNKADVWKGIMNKAPHLHLVLDGHEIWIPKKQSGGGYKAEDIGKKTKARPFLDDVKKRFETAFESDMEKFLNGVFE